MTRAAYVIGKPIGHSLSPHMHNAAFAACGLDCHYEAVEIEASDLGDWAARMRGSDAYGFNVTVPHKEGIVRHLDDLEGDAALCGAVNTVRVAPGDQPRLLGTNTDTLGFRRSLHEEAGTSLEGQRVVLLGAGGAARAIAVVALQDGAAELVIANRHVERAHDLVAALSALVGSTRVCVAKLEPAALAPVLADGDIVVNATSVGLRSWDAPIRTEMISPTSLVVDIVYNPLRTALLTGAERQGARVLGGLGMLVFQAAAAFELWTGVPAPVAAMRSAAEKALPRPEGS
jgi:shikimate dehydrogenase